MNKNQISNLLVFKTWIAASYVSIIFHVTDIPYYDGKIAILFWIFLAGMKTYIDQNQLEN